MIKTLNLLTTICTLIIYTSLVCAQYKYIGDYPIEACNRTSSPAIYHGYSCNGDMSCDTNLTYRSQYPYSTISSIASLFGVDSNTVAQRNPNYSTGVVEWNKLVYVPVTCGCQSGWLYYRKDITYTVGEHISNFYDIPNNTFQGLTTCQAIRDANPNKAIYRGDDIPISLRCACPTTSQKENGVTSLITYVVGSGDTTSSISTQLNLDAKSIREANDLKEDSTLYPFTTLLIPVMKNSSGVESNSTSSTSHPAASTLSKGAIGGIAAAGCAALAAFCGAAYKFNLCGSFFKCFNKKVINNFYNGTKEEDRTGDEEPKVKYDRMSKNGSSDSAIG